VTAASAVAAPATVARSALNGLRRRFRDPHAVFQRQLAITVVSVLSLLILIRDDINAAQDWIVVLSVGLVLAALAASYAAPLHHRPQWLLIVIPLTDLLAVGLLRWTTGGGASLFSALLILPCMSLGIERGRLPVICAALGCAAVIGVPLALTPTPDDWLRVLTTPLVLTMTAVTVNELTARLRERVRSENRLRRDQEALLAAAEQHATTTAEVAALLRQSAALMSGVVDAVTEQSIIATDADGRVEVFNRGAERMLAVPAAQALGRALLHSVGERFVERPNGPASMVGRDGARTLADVGFDRLVADARRGRAAASVWTYHRPGGATATIEMSVTVRTDRRGDVEGFLVVGTDVSEMYEQARLKDEFVSLISHELRTPLSSILGYLELIADDEDAPLSAEQAHYLDIVERNAHRLLRLVGDLLLTASLEAGKLRLETAPVDLGGVAAASVMSAQPAATTAGITVTLDVPDLPVVVDADATRLGQICDNLLSNAIKFTPRGGRIEVVLSASEPSSGGPIRLSVRDSGMGIQAADLDKLFARFFRTSTATNQAVPGVGLGLSISRAIAIAHGGAIRVESTPGEGSVFTLELPAREPAAAGVSTGG
jgi:signal transduction histidine kinase